MVREVLSHRTGEALVDEGFVQVVLIAIAGDDVLRFPSWTHSEVNVKISVMTLDRVRSGVRIHWLDYCWVQTTNLQLLTWFIAFIFAARHWCTVLRIEQRSEIHVVITATCTIWFKLLDDAALLSRGLRGVLCCFLLSPLLNKSVEHKDLLLQFLVSKKHRVCLSQSDKLIHRVFYQTFQNCRTLWFGVLASALCAL